jgi:UDP-N-acetylglucosamine--N-acetylmuramyl-(pentapeptide) pyrophosphoryl-undecaprenol N-acetylglucosamine transferase
VRVVIAGGGTGGHTSAGLAVASALLERGADLHWIGSRAGIEARRVPEAGIPFHVIQTGKLRRYWDWQNIPDLVLRTPAGFVQSCQLLRRLRPSLLFATGGFVSLPPALAARTLGIPIVVHEQTAVPGLANRIVARFARRIALSFPPIGTVVSQDRSIVTGNPLRPELIGGSRDAGCRRFSLDPTQPIVYITGGAQGSHKINRTVGEALPDLLTDCQVIHQCGDNAVTGDRAWLSGRAEALPLPLARRYVVITYVGGELGDVYAAADLVVGRSGAGTVNECLQLGKAAVYIPLPGTSGDEQTVNARLVERAGGGVLLPQSSLTAARLLETVKHLLASPAALADMGQRARSLAVPDAAQRIAQLIVEAATAGVNQPSAHTVKPG